MPHTGPDHRFPRHDHLLLAYPQITPERPTRDPHRAVQSGWLGSAESLALSEILDVVDLAATQVDAAGMNLPHPRRHRRRHHRRLPHRPHRNRPVNESDTTDRGQRDGGWDIRVVFVERKSRWWWNAWRAATSTELYGFADSRSDAWTAMNAAINARAQPDQLRERRDRPIGGAA